RFRGAIRIVSSQGVILSITPIPSPALVTFVAGDADHCPHAVNLPHRLQKIDSAANVDIERFFGLSKAPADERLSSQVENDLRLHAFQNVTQMSAITNIARDVLDVAGQSQRLKQTW